MKTTVLLSILTACFVSHISLFAYAMNDSQSWTRSTTEAGSCEGGRCLATSQKSNLMQFCESLKGRALWAQDWQCQNTSIFDDGNDRSILYELRKKSPNTLTAEEKAILQAADRYGNVGFCNRVAGNASVIVYNGRPAIITSAHMFYDQKTGKQKCSDQDLKNAIFMPNVSYYDSESGDYPQSLTHKKVGVVMPPVAIEGHNPKDNQLPENDFIIFYLKEDITKDIMPGGNTRGAMSFASGSARDSGKLHMIGMASDVRQGLAVVQQSCNYKGVRFVGLKHDCDTVSGSSGSALLVMQGGELKLRGIHTSDLSGGKVVPATSDILKWNFGTDFVENKHLD